MNVPAAATLPGVDKLTNLVRMREIAVLGDENRCDFDLCEHPLVTTGGVMLRLV